MDSLRPRRLRDRRFREVFRGFPPCGQRHQMSHLGLHLGHLRAEFARTERVRHPLRARGHDWQPGHPEKQVPVLTPILRPLVGSATA